MLWPSARARRAICGFAAVFRPRRKNVARTHSFLSAFRILVVVPGQGPSSNVSTSSFSPSGSVEGNCLRPTRGVFLTSTSSTRSVPSASGLPGHGAATAVHGAITKEIATRHIRVMKHSLPHSSVSGKLASPYTFNRLHEAHNWAYKPSRFIFLPTGLRHARPGTGEQQRGRCATSAQQGWLDPQDFRQERRAQD